MRVLSVTLFCVLALSASAAARPPVESSDDLWATVNVCDSPAKPDRLGIRASMPALARRTTMWMRFRVQYLSEVDDKWHNVQKGGVSAWIRVGRGRTGVYEAGQDFAFPPPAGEKYLLRGAVTFRWKRRGKIVKTVRELTESGHTSTRGADPPGYSAATCEIT